MSAVVLGKRNSSYFSEELNRLPPFSVSKKARLKSSPASEPELFLSPFEHLRSVFPEIEEQVTDEFDFFYLICLEKRIKEI